MARQFIPLIAALLAAPAHAADPGQIVFVAGQAEVEGDPARVGATVQEGDRLRTGGDGYLYIRTADQRLVIVRPQTDARFAREMAAAATAGSNSITMPAAARVALPVMAGTVPEVAINPDLDARKNGELQARLPQFGATGNSRPPDLAAQPQVVSWGRWEKVIDRTPNATLENLAATTPGLRRIAANQVYVLFRGDDGTPYLTPARGSAGFALAASEAYVRDAGTGQRTAASLSDGRLTVDFARATFATSVEVRDQDASYRLSAVGRVAKDGQFGTGTGTAQPGAMQVAGALAGNGGATYLLEGALTPSRTVSGVATWRATTTR